MELSIEFEFDKDRYEVELSWRPGRAEEGK